MLHANNISCTRGGRNLFSKLSFSVNEGKCLHIKGENGSGKSSLLKIMAGLAHPEEGYFTWLNKSTREHSDSFYSDLLFIGHKSGINQHLSAEQNLAWYAAISESLLNETEQKDILKKIGLFGFEDIPAGKLSAGQQRRIALCRLLIEKKKLWILDEPLASLDQQGIKLFEALLQNHLLHGGSAIFTSHQDLVFENKSFENNLIEILDISNFKHETELFDEGSVE
jgi:heme exporter protein A